MSSSNSALVNHSERGLRVVILYKLVKACVQAGAAIILVVLLVFGLSDWIHHAVVTLRSQATESWSVAVAEWLLREATPKHEDVAVVALAGDALLSGAESYCLHKRYRWAPWVVAGLTGSLLPFELFHLLRHPRIGRLLLVLLNVLMLVYLVLHARKVERAHAQFQERIKQQEESASAVSQPTRESRA